MDGSFTPSDIGGLIFQQLSELGISRRELAENLGCRSIPEALKKLDALIVGDVQKAEGMVRSLSLALFIPEQSSPMHWPSHAYINRKKPTVRLRPPNWSGATNLDPSHCAASFLADHDGPFRWGQSGIDVELEPDRPSALVSQVVTELRSILIDGALPLVGLALGFEIAFTPDRTGRFTLDGVFVGIVPTAGMDQESPPVFR
ncbi:hypothetical protein [Alsobacter sp. SYSU BS001988]